MQRLLSTNLRFSERHWHDIQTILRYYENQDEVEDSID